MKKSLLSILFVMLAVVGMNAAEVTFDFKTNTYGIPGQEAGSGANTAFFSDVTTTPNDGVTITFAKSAGNGFRFWTDGLRVYKGTASMKFEANGTITGVSLTYKATSGTVSVDGTNLTLAGKTYTWTGSKENEITVDLVPTANNAIETVVVTYTPGAVDPDAVEKPVIAYDEESATVTLTCETAGASIYYVLADAAATPTASDKLYSAPFQVEKSCTVSAIAIKNGKSSPVATKAVNVPVVYDGFAAFIAAAPKTNAKVAGPITAVYQNGINLYAKDSKGGWMLVYNKSNVPGGPYVNGDQISFVTGTYEPYNELPEMVPAAFGEKTAGTAVQPEELTIEELSLDMVNQYVKIAGVTIELTSGKNYKATDATGSVVLYNTFAAADEKVEVPEGEGFTVIGFVNRYKETLQITPISVTGGTVMEEVAAPVFSPEAGPVDAGTKVTISCATEGAVIFYSTDGTEPTAASTKYEDAIVIEKATTIKAIAVKEGMLNSAVVTANYTIFDPNKTEATFNFTDAASLGLETPAESKDVSVAGMTFTNNGVTLTISDKAGSNTNPRLYNSQGKVDLRLYFNADNTQYFTVAVAAGYKLTSIDFTKAGGALAIAPDNGEFAVDGNAGTWTASADAVTTSVKFSTTATTRISTITVNYSKNSGVEAIEAADEAAEAEYYNLQGVRVDNPAAGLYIKKQGSKVSKVIIR